MKKSISKVLTLMLAFAMVFTSIGWLGAYDVNADELAGSEGMTAIESEEAEGSAESAALDIAEIETASKAVDYVDMQANHNDEWNTSPLGVAVADIDKDKDLILDVRADDKWAEGRLIGSIHVNITKDENLENKKVKAGSPLARALDAAYEAKGSGKIVVVCNSGQTLAARALQYFNEKYYEGKGIENSEVTYLKGGAKDGFGNAALETTVDYTAVQKEAARWAKHGANYKNVAADDFILDVRNDDAWKTGFLPGSVHISVNTTDTSLVNGGKVVDGSLLAKALDSAFAASEGKRIVVICNSGQVLAARAIEYINTKNYGGKGVDLSRITFLIGGASNPQTTQIPASDKVTALDYVTLRTGYPASWQANGIPYADITANDFILDVRADDKYDEGHIKGSTHVNVTAPATDLEGQYVKADSAMAKALDDAFAAAGGKRIVVICNSGQSLAARTLQYFNTKNYGGLGVDYTKVTFLQGGRTAIPAGDLITTAEENSPKDGQTVNVDGNEYVVTSAAAKTAALTKAASKKSATVPATINVNGYELAVTGISAKAFKGTKVKTLTVKTKKLTKKSVKGSLKGSKVKTVKVKVGKKKTNKKYVKKYKKIFTKKNAGKKVRVK